MDNIENNIQVAFVQKINEGEFETETIWFERDGKNFVIDNIPFIAKRISLGDTVKAEYDEDEKMYYFDDFVKISGNSTIRIFFYDDNEIESTRKWLDNNNCESEVLPVRSIVAVNIPKNTNYLPIKNYLDDGENGGKWVYEESCLEHQY